MVDVKKMKKEYMAYIGRLNHLMTLHREVLSLSYMSLADIRKPQEPKALNKHFEAADQAWRAYKPTLWHRLLRRVEDKKIKLLEDKKAAVLRDKVYYQEAYQTWLMKQKDYVYANDLYKGILSGDIQGYDTWFKRLHPLGDLEALGTVVDIDFDRTCTLAKVTTNPLSLIPEENRSIRRYKEMFEKDKLMVIRNDVYKAYVLSESLRVARELMTSLPMDQVIVNSGILSFDEKKQKKIHTTIVSVVYSRGQMDKIKVDQMDLSTIFCHFDHRMSYCKTEGFAQVVSYEKTVEGVG